MIQVNGIWLPDEDTYFAAYLQKNSLWEPEKLQEALTYVTGQRRLALDIGAHVGLYSCVLADAFEKVHAFEANPATHACLEKNMCQFTNVFTHNVAVGPREGSVLVEKDKDRVGNTGSYFVRPQLSSAGDVTMLSIDSLSFDTVDFVKIDVEGFETNVLRGMLLTLDRCGPVIMIEEKNFKSRYDLAPARDILLSMGYTKVISMRNDHVYVRR